MKCPKCNKQAISKFRFIIKMTLKSFTCQNCGTVLKFRKLPRRIYYTIIIIIAFLFGFSKRRIEDIFDINISWLLILLTIIVIAIIADIIMWRYGKLEEVEEK